jgi:peptide/nickel transport system substrate-binding protein
MRFSPKKLAAAIAALAVLALAGCTSSPTEPTEESSVTVALTSAPTSFAFGALDLGSPTNVWTSIYTTILRINGDGSISPAAAESYSYNADRTELTLSIRSGMTFSNDKKIDASIVKACLDYFKENGTNASNLQFVTGVEAKDESTVVISLSQPDPTLLGALTRDSGAIADPDTFGDESRALDPISSGAYDLDLEKTVNGDTYTLHRRSGLYNEDEYPFETVVFKVIADATAALNALKSGQLSAGGLNQSTLKEAEASNITVNTTPGGVLFALYLYDRDGEALPALGDLRVRQAINYAIDRKQIVASLLAGNAQIATQVYAPGSVGYDPDLDDAYPYDVEKAKSLMADAGYADGFDITMPSFSYTLPFEPTITQQLADIGIRVTWQTIEITQLATNITSRSYPMLYSLNGISSAQTDTGSFVGENGPGNPFHTTNAEVAALLEEASLADGPEAEKSVYTSISKYLVDNAWFAPIFYGPIQIGTVEGYDFDAPEALFWPDIRMIRPSKD